MPISFVCIVVAYALIWVPRCMVLYALSKLPGGMDNNNPRDQQAKLEGWPRRANAAHNNAIEGFAPFALAVLVSYVLKANPDHANLLAMVYVAVRLVYLGLYVGNIPSARSLVWLVGLAATSGLFLLPWLSPAR